MTSNDKTKKYDVAFQNPPNEELGQLQKSNDICTSCVFCVQSAVHRD